MRAEAPSRLRALADYLGATIYNVDGGQQWFIMHYGVGEVTDEPVGHSSWDCLGRLAYVALSCEANGGHGCTPQELQEVTSVPWSVTLDQGRLVLVLPEGIDGTTDAVLSLMVRDEFHKEYEL